MGVDLRHFPEFKLEFGMFYNAVNAREMLGLFERVDKQANFLGLFCGDVDLSGVDIANIPAIKRAAAPDGNGSNGGAPGRTALVSGSGRSELFVHFWIHYVGQGAPLPRPHAKFPTVVEACRWLGLPQPVPATLGAAAAEAEAGPTVDEAAATENRRRILRAASRLFRERGLYGATEAEIMVEAGLTHARFDRYFKSRDDLVFHATLDAMLDFTPPDAMADYIRFYLSPEHKADCAGGCPVAALAPDIAHQSLETRAAMTAGLSGRIDLLTQSAPGADAPSRRSASIRAISAVVGALIVARMSDDPDLSQEFLDEIQAWLADKPAGATPPAHDRGGTAPEPRAT